MPDSVLSVPIRDPSHFTFARAEHVGIMASRPRDWFRVTQPGGGPAEAPGPGRPDLPTAPLLQGSSPCPLEKLSVQG